MRSTVRPRRLDRRARRPITCVAGGAIAASRRHLRARGAIAAARAIDAARRRRALLRMGRAWRRAAKRSARAAARPSARPRAAPPRPAPAALASRCATWLRAVSTPIASACCVWAFGLRSWASSCRVSMRASTWPAVTKSPSRTRISRCAPAMLGRRRRSPRPRCGRCRWRCAPAPGRRCAAASRPPQRRRRPAATPNGSAQRLMFIFLSSCRQPRARPPYFPVERRSPAAAAPSAADRGCGSTLGLTHPQVDIVAPIRPEPPFRRGA
jgi:hypothetical protein